MTDIEIIKQIEKKARVTLKKLDIKICEDFSETLQGYVIDEKGSVIGLRLDKVSNFSTRLFSELKQLKILGLYKTNKKDYAFLRQLKELTKLELSEDLTDVSFLKELKGLTNLDLSGNELADVSFLKELENITSLDINGNPLKIPPTEIADKGIKGYTGLF